MSAFLVMRGAPITVEFPMDTLDDVESAVAYWMENSTVIRWVMTDDRLEKAFTLLVNFGLVPQAMVTRTNSDDGKTEIVRAVLNETAGGWDIRDLAG